MEHDIEKLTEEQLEGMLTFVVNMLKAMVEKMFNGAATVKEALIITPEKVIVTTPGADNKKVL